MEFPALKAKQDELTAKRDELGRIFAEAGSDLDLAQVKSLDGDTAAKAAEIARRNDELTDLGKEVDRLKAVAKAAEAHRTLENDVEEAARKGFESGADRNGPTSAKSFGDQFIESAAFKSKGAVSTLDIGLKALFDTGASQPETTRTDRVVDFATRPVELLDLIPQTVTGQAAVTYMEETTFTNAAAETAEGAAKPEAALALTERSSSVRKIAVWIPVTDETLEDVPRAASYLNNRLPFMVRQRLAGQIIAGNGTAPNLRGVLNVSGIQTQAKGSDPTPDAVYKAITKVETVGQAMPDAYVTNPIDWQDIRLLRTADGMYIWGNPSEAGPERIWGLRVIKAQAMTENTGVVGDFGNFSELAVRKGIEVAISDSHDDFFVTNKQAVRAEMRAALLFYRPTAFCSVTGI